MSTSRAVRSATLLGLAAALGLLAPAAGAGPIRTRPGPARPAPEPEQRQAAETPAVPPLPAVGGLRWEGNEHLADSQLAAVAFTRGPSWRIWRKEPEFSESTLAGDMRRIESLYQLHGFYEARATYLLEWNDDRSRVAITVRIDEGPGVTLTRFEVEIPDDLDASDEERAGLLADLPLVVGERISADRYARAKQSLLDRLAEAAHPLARIEGGATVELEDHHAEVTWQVVPGPTIYFGDVRITGLYKVSEQTTRREVRFERGQRYSPRALQRTRRRLQQQGLYSWVTVQSRPAEAEPAGEDAPGPSPDSEQIWPVEIRVTERSPYTLDAGVGYSSDESFRASVGWRDGNFLGDARKLRLTALYSGILSKLQAEYTQPYFLDRDLSLIVRGSLRRENEPVFTADRVLTSIGLSRPLWGSWRGRANYEFSWQDVVRTNLGASVILREPEGVSKTATIELGLRHQTLDELLAPTRGTWFDFVVAPSFEEIGSDFDFVTFFVEARGFLPLYQGSVLAGRIRIGAQQPFRDTTARSIPVTSRFYAGGSSSHRGFQYHQMPPFGVLDVNVGGTSLLESTLEWRFPIWRRIGGVAFVDAGLLDLRPWTYHLDKLFWAVGPGLRYDTVIGPLRFDYGFLINPPLGASRHQWFISVGHTF